MQFTFDVNVRLSLDPASISAIVREVVAVHNQLDRIHADVHHLEALMSKADDKVTAFLADLGPKLDTLGTLADSTAASVANIAADEASIKAALDQAIAGADLSPETEAAMQAVSEKLGVRVTKSQEVAAAAQSLADSVPDAPPVG